MLNIIAIIATVTLMVSFNALYVASEFSTVSSRKTRVSQLAGRGNRMARSLLAIMENDQLLDNYVAACQVGITISSLVLGAYGQNKVAVDLEAPLAQLLVSLNLNIDAMAVASTISAIGVITFFTVLQVVVGELLPKSIAIQYPEQVAMAVVLPTRWTMTILGWLIAIFNGSGRLVLRLLGFQQQKEGHSHLHSPEEIELLVSESHEGGLLDDEERQMLRNAFRLRDLTARQVMVHRTRLIAAPVNSTVAELINLSIDNGYSRIPLYEETIDHVKGFVHIKDLFRLYVADNNNLATILRDVVYIPESSPAVDAWDILRASSQYIGIVFDEFGGTAGMITIEDLIEEIFGEVQDEFDNEAALMSQDKQGRIYLRSDLLIADVNEYLSLNLPDDAADTLSGLIFSQLGRTPEEGDEIKVNGTTIRVESMADLGVSEVSLQIDTTLTNTEWEVEERE